MFFFPRKGGKGWVEDATRNTSSLGKFQMCRLGSTMKINLSGKRFIHLQRCARWGRWRCNCEDHLTKRVLWMAVVSQWHLEPCVWWIVKFLWCVLKTWKRYRDGKHFPCDCIALWRYVSFFFTSSEFSFRCFLIFVKPLSSEIRRLYKKQTEWHRYDISAMKCQ